MAPPRQVFNGPKPGRYFHSYGAWGLVPPPLPPAHQPTRVQDGSFVPPMVSGPTGRASSVDSDRQCHSCHVHKLTGRYPLHTPEYLGYALLDLVPCQRFCPYNCIPTERGQLSGRLLVKGQDSSVRVDPAPRGHDTHTPDSGPLKVNLFAFATAFATARQSSG